MEHVHNPMDYMLKCAELLDTGGIFYFISPAETSCLNWMFNIIRRITGKQTTSYLAPYIPSYHLVGFSKKGVKIMAEKAGLQLVRRIRRYDYFGASLLAARKSVIYYPVALVLWLADIIGWGGNQEIILRKY
jgi:hypothetical protein